MKISNQKKYKEFLIIPIFKNIKSENNYLLSKEYVIERIIETTNLVSSLNSSIVKTLKININTINVANLFTKFMIDRVLLSINNGNKKDI